MARENAMGRRWRREREAEEESERRVLYDRVYKRIRFGFLSFLVTFYALDGRSFR